LAIGAFVPLVFFVLIVGSVGVRLVSLWRRTRQLPELALGAGLLIVSFSMPFTAIGRAPVTAMEPIGRTCFAAGLYAIALGLSLLVFFNYWVFRRQSGWGRALSTPSASRRSTRSSISSRSSASSTRTA
jgi:hypothetical protein